jgi:hypothetical protein
MTMNVNRLALAFFGNSKPLGRRGSPLLELYTQSIFGEVEKKSAQSFCRLRRQIAPGV